jgi:hypothetical protein
MSNAQAYAHPTVPVKPPLTAYQRTLTQLDVDALCRAARLAWRTASPSRRRVPLVWRGKRFVVRHTSFHLLVHEANGQPVACCWD